MRPIAKLLMVVLSFLAAALWSRFILTLSNIYGSLDPHGSAPTKRHLDRFSHFYSSLVWSTHRHKISMCDICSNRPHLMYCMHVIYSRDKKSTHIRCKFAACFGHSKAKGLFTFRGLRKVTSQQLHQGSSPGPHRGYAPDRPRYRPTYNSCDFP